MKTECTQTEFEFQGLGRRKVEAKFDGGAITSDAGGLLLREVEERFGILRRFSRCFTDHRDPDLIEHTAQELVAQRTYGLALGYEDLDDHDDLRQDPLLATLVGKADPTGQSRVHQRDQGKPLAGKSTLNRLELTPADAKASDRYKKIVARDEEIKRFFVEVFLALRPQTPERIVLDLDATDDPLHGEQEGRFFHGHYQEYCYLPLYVFCGHDLLCAQLRPSDIDAAAGAKETVERIVAQIRERWPDVAIVLRGDSGFCRDELMAWCEQPEVGVDYLFGLAQNSRLKAEIAAELAEAKQVYGETGDAARVFKDFRYRTRESWSQERRVVAKAEHLSKGSNPRFVVTSLSAEVYDARTLYEREYCARGEMENRIKEQQLDLFADRTSTSWMRSNQLRLWFSSVAYVLVNAFRHWGLKGTELARAQCGTIREKIFKIGARVRVSVRRVRFSLSEGCPYQAAFAAAWRNVRHLPLRC